MDSSQVGKVILELRKEKGMTQKQLGDLLNVSDKTISKWERGAGCPDISLLHQLSRVLQVDIDGLLQGKLDEKEKDGGNMKKVRFYVCPICKNIITPSSEAEISCCGRKVEALVPKPEEDAHKLKVEEIENDYYVTFDHDMSKEHYISFVALVTCDRIELIRLYPEQSGEVRFTKRFRGKFYYYCTEHGLRVK